MMTETESPPSIGWSTSEMAVKVRDAYKRHSKSTVVLKGFNMTVPKGIIYSLLGPSGCGKTTLLTCIVGRMELDAGSIELGIDKRKHIGYMPQSLCLHHRMTILENFYFYGYLFGMSEERIQERITDLMSFLELPSGNRIIADLSGGQQRRVSVAVTLIHEPTLLILDEPTVGLDPVLSQSIWARLKEMTKFGTSVIITTHYIQDAHHANLIGLMRDGVLLAEESPLALMQRCQCTDLEDAFLQLSKKQDTVPNEVQESIQYPQSNKPVKVFFKDSKKVFSTTKFKGLFYKNTVLLKRDYMILITALILPFLNTFLFNATIGRNPKGLSIGIVNEEISLSECSSFSYNSCFLNSSERIPVSCLYMDLLREQNYKVVEYQDELVAKSAVKQNKVWALLHFGKNFSSALADRVSYGYEVDPESIPKSFINTWIDSTNSFFGSLIKYDVTRVLTSFLEQIMLSCEINPRIGAVPISFEEPIFGSFDENFISYASCALMCINCFILPSVWTCIQMFLEKYDGILDRTMAAGVGVPDMVTSVFIFQFLVHIIQTIISMSVMYVMFENPMRGNFYLFFSLMIITGTAGIFYGIALGIFSDDFLLLGGLSNAIVMTICLITGLAWPVEGMHDVLKTSTLLFPVTWIVSATRAICLKSFSFFTPVVMTGFASAVVLNVGFLFLIFIISKYKKTAFTTAK